MSLDHALACASVGWHVFPVEARGKRPLVRWADWATIDPATITAEFAGRDLNYGIACGPSGILVIDEDELDALPRFAASLGQTVPITYTVRTGRGRHFYFQAPAGVELGNAEGVLKGRGLNVRGNGGYVVGYGSTHASGAVYSVEVDAPLAECPPWLIAALQSPRSSPNGASPYDPPPVHLGGLAAVPEVIRGPRDGTPDQRRPGERHDALVSYACSLRARDVPQDEAEVLIGAVWRRCEQPPVCATPLPLDDALGTLRDIYTRYPPGYSAEMREVGAADCVTGDHGDEFGLSLLGDIDTTPVSYRVEDVLTVGGRCVLIGQRKLGKTHLALNLCRSLLLAEKFLGRFPVERVTGTIAFVNSEVSRQMFAGWARQAGVPPDRLIVANTRGLPSPFADPKRLERFAGRLHALGVEVIVLDTFGRLYGGRSQNDAAEVSAFLLAVDRLAHLAGISEVILTAHAGWTEDGRARGSSALEDWPDAIMRLTGDEEKARYLAVEGRDVEVDQQRLEFDPVTRRVRFAELPINRKQAREQALVEELVPEVVAIVKSVTDPTVSMIVDRLGGRRQRGFAAVDLAHGRGLIVKAELRNRTVYRPESSSREAGNPDPSSPVNTGSSQYPLYIDREPEPASGVGSAGEPDQPRTNTEQPSTRTTTTEHLREHLTREQCEQNGRALREQYVEPSIASPDEHGADQA